MEFRTPYARLGISIVCIEDNGIMWVGSGADKKAKQFKCVIVSNRREQKNSEIVLLLLSVLLVRRIDVIVAFVLHNTESSSQKPYRTSLSAKLRFVRRSKRIRKWHKPA